MSALEQYPEYLAFRNRGTPEEQVAPDESDGPAVWMIRAGRGGRYAPRVRRAISGRRRLGPHRRCP